MPDVDENASPVQELRNLLPELPLDGEQRASVSHNLDFVDEVEIDSVLRELKTSLGFLDGAIQEINSMMASSSVEVIRDATPSQAYEFSVREPA